uniref:Putative calcineurin-like phosphoesterase n=2 Tax=viral metagenome TaxID=1070528 RepID=A0A6M3LB15_9ZZZZ
MLEFIVCSDFHFYKNPSKSDMSGGGMYSWLVEQLSILEDIVQYALNNNVKTLYHCGDLFEERGRIPQDLYNIVWERFREYSKKLNIILIPGNHDVYSYNKETGLKPFSDICHVPTDVEDIYLEDIFIRLAPFGRIQKAKNTPEDHYNEKLLFMHEDLSGAGLFLGENYYPDYPIDCKDLSGWDFVFNGHLHKPFEFGNIINIGSPMIQDWGEADQEKRFVHYKDGKIKFIPIDCPKFIHFEILNDETKAVINNRDFFRYDIGFEEAKDPIFQKWNVSYRIKKSEEKERRLDDKRDDLDIISEYYDKYSDVELNKEKVLRIAKELING